MSSDIKISFIIPAYNVDKYISKCLQSICMQNINKKEIIVVDDGSTDESFMIAETYLKSQKGIEYQVVRQKNAGVSAARNTGIKIAKGKYICFVDADDYYIENFAENFYTLCENNDLDVIRGIYAIDDNPGSNDLIHVNKKILTYYNEVICGVEFLKKSIVEHANEVVPWLGFFRKSFLIQNDLLFPEGIGYEEDQLFFLRCLLIPNVRIMQVDCEFYAYTVRKGSATKSAYLKQIKDVLWIVKQEEKTVSESKLKIQDRYYCACYIGSSFYQLTSIYGRLNFKDRKDTINLCKNTGKYIYILCAGTLHQRIKIFLFIFFPRLVGMVYEYRRKRNIN